MKTHIDVTTIEQKTVKNCQIILMEDPCKEKYVLDRAFKFISLRVKK